jgi:hypothetical protein
MQVAEALAAFAATQHSMTSLGCSRASLRDVTADNRDPEELTHFPLLPDLIQCGEIAVAELPASAPFGPAPFVLASCSGSSLATPSSVPTIGGENWIIWPWYAPKDWMSETVAVELTSDLGLSPAQEPYTLTLEGADPSGRPSAASCYALRGFAVPRAPH